ncbi:peptidyl-prolyl cis-trans isomerase [bacterium]|nr:peptidyl-prolyl cis-trans isomerase [bacterium]
MMLRNLSLWGLPILFLIAGLVVGNVAGKNADAFAASDTLILEQGGNTYDLDDYSLFLFMNSSDVIEIFIDMVVIRSEAESRGLKVTEAEVDEFIAGNMVSTDGRNRYDQYVELFDKDTIRRQIAMQILSEKLEKQLRDEIVREQNLNVTEKDAKDFFLEHIAEIHRPAMVDVSLLSTSDRAKCEEALRRLEGGADFNELSAEMSDIKELAQQGGHLGRASYRDLESINSTLADTAFGLSDEQYSDIIRGEHNFHIVFVHQKLPEYTPTFDEIKDDLREQIFEAKLKPLMANAYNRILAKGYESVEPKVRLLEPKNRGTGDSEDG